jgi:hypothetical protein
MVAVGGDMVFLFFFGGEWGGRKRRLDWGLGFAVIRNVILKAGTDGSWWQTQT